MQPTEPPRRPPLDPAGLLALTAASGTIAFAWAQALHLPWRPVTLALVGLVGLVGLVMLVSQFAPAVSADRRRAILVPLAFVCAVFLLRWIPVLGGVAPPGGDMSMHTWLARVALEHRILPDTQMPLYPGVPYGAYPLGFHGLAALLAGHVEGLLPATLAMIALAHTLFAAGVYAILRARCTPVVAALGALATVLVLRNPQAYVGWGGNPCVLGFAFAMFAWQAMQQSLARPTVPGVVLTSTFAAATACTHPTAALVLALALAATSLVGALGALRQRRTFAWPIVPVTAVVALLLAAPMLGQWMRSAPSGVEQAWIATHHLLPPQSPPLGRALLPDYWQFVFGDAALLWAAIGLAAAIAQGRVRASGGALLVLVLVPFAAVAYRHSGLPLSLALYPERVMLVLVVPWSLLLASVIEWILAQWGRSEAARPRWTRAASVVVAVALAGTALVNAARYHVRPAIRSQPVDRLDARAFDALRARVIASAGAPAPVVAHRTGDAAAFLPGLWGVASTHPQWNPVWMEELEAWRALHPPTYVYERRSASDPAVEGASTPPDAVLVARFGAGIDTVLVWQTSPVKR